METGTGPSSDLHSFTPVRRRESTVNIRHFQADPEQKWTAARCHRLLRALTSRVAILNKEIARYTPAPNGGDLKAASCNANASSSEDWNRTQKRIRRTYSSKGAKNGNAQSAPSVTSRNLKSSKGRRSLIPGEISIPTPILARARGENMEAIPAVAVHDFREPENRRNKRSRARYMTDDAEAHCELAESLRDIRQKTTAARYTTYEGIYNGLEALLRATTPVKLETKRRKGARSLFSTSLRAVPRYIIQQEALLQAHMEETGSISAIESRDISMEIYDELESLGSSEHGWNRLKVIVRSHGVEVISDAIQSGLLNVDFCGALASLCVHMSATDEAQRLLSALLSSTVFPLPKTLYETLGQPLVMLSKFTEYTGSTSFQYRQLSGILSNGLLPLDWLTTKEFGPVWTRAVQSLSPDSVDEDALAFLDTSLSLLLAAEESNSGQLGRSGATVNAVAQAIKNTLSSVLTTLSSIVVLSMDTPTQNQRKLGTTSPAYEYISTLLRSGLLQSRLSGISSSAGTLLLLAYLVVQHERGDFAQADSYYISLLPEYLSQVGDNFMDVSTVYNDATMFICRIARCCGRGASSSGFAHIERLHRILETQMGDGDINVLKSLIVDSAFAFAQQVSDRKHLDYAATLDEKFSARLIKASSDLESLSDCDEDSSGFRWEEGIGEWVTATPALSNPKRKCVAEILSADDPYCETPFRPPPKLRFRMEKEVASPASSLQTREPPMSPVEQEIAADSSRSEEQLIEDGSRSDKDSSCHSSPDASSDDELLAESDSSRNLEVLSPSDASASEMEVSFAEESVASNTSSPSLPFQAVKKTRQSIGRTPRLSTKLLRNSQDWQIFDESSVCTVSSSSSGSQQNSDRVFVDRAPRLGRRVLRSSQAWQIFDESDDELSILSVSSKGDRVLQDVTNVTAISNSRRTKARAGASLTQRKSVLKTVVALSDSEDELCIRMG